MGSPPRMRGKVSFADLTKTAFGITPAYAGKSPERPGTSALTGDHPRVCGEKGVWNAEQARVEGSPPRMRGKVGVPSGIFGFAGITPAYAGKRVRMIFDLYTVGDHPRICGEKFPNIHVPVCRSGSSPHMRGKDCGVADMVLPVRITPAYAGKSFEHTR